MPLDLSDRPIGPVLAGSISIDQLTWWFWVKAGIGFALGSGIVYVVANVVWFEILVRMPSLWIGLRMMRSAGL
jgi:hypothetical protein